MFTTDGVYATWMIKTYRKRKYSRFFVCVFFSTLKEIQTPAYQVSKLIPLVYLSQANKSKKNTTEGSAALDSVERRPWCIECSCFLSKVIPWFMFFCFRSTQVFIYLFFWNVLWFRLIFDLWRLSSAEFRIWKHFKASCVI